MRCLLLILLALLAGPAQAFEQLKNDSAAPGGEIAFYPALQGDEGFHVRLDGPERHDVYQICRALLWIGPNDFSIFTMRIIDTDLDFPEAVIWDTGLDAYQIFGSREDMSAVDLRDQRIITSARNLEVRFTHAPGAGGPPTIASDTDGIQPMRNRVRIFQRNGEWFWDFTENIPEDGPITRPPGDWIVRLDVVGVDEGCPRPDAPPDPMDFGVPDDMGGDDRMDAGVPDMQVVDARPMPDATVRDAAPPERDRAIIPDATLLDAAPEDRGGRDLGDRPGAFRIDRIVPGSGPPDRNVDVVINGQGFPFGEDITARLGDTRLLEATVRGEGTITAIVPAGIAPGLYSLSVIRADGQEAILPSAYTVLDAGELALVSVRPTDIVEGRIATLDLVGAGFDDTTQFFVDTVELTDPIISSSTEATATLSAPLVAGEYDVLAVRGEHSAILRGGLTVRRPSSAVSDDCGCRVGRNADAPMAIWGLLGLLLWRRRRCA